MYASQKPIANAASGSGTPHTSVKTRTFHFDNDVEIHPIYLFYQNEIYFSVFFFVNIFTDDLNNIYIVHFYYTCNKIHNLITSEIVYLLFDKSPKM